MSYCREEGYMCHFGVRMDKNMIWPDPRNQPENCIRFLFHAQYILRRKRGCSKDEIVDTSGAIYTVGLEQPLVQEHLEMFMALNFARWGLPYSVRRTLYRDVANHVHLMKAHSENVGCTDLPIDVSIDIYTVQKENEDINVTMSRLIKSKTFAFVKAAELPEYQVPEETEPEHISMLANLLQRTRVEGEDYAQECSICLEKPHVGTEICFLPCSHCYHFKCILRWLEKSPLCPFCRARIGNDPPEAQWIM